MSGDALWGVGQWTDEHGERRAWAISNPEMQRDIGAAARTVGELGIGPGGRVLITSMLSEAGQFWPFTVGVMLAGAQLSLADATAGEAARVDMFTRLLRYDAVLGITPELLDGLDELGRPYPEVFGAIPLLGARPGAYERLDAVGLSPSHFVLVGPAVAVARAPGEPARLDPAEWSVTQAADGHLCISNVAPRAAAFDAARTAVMGSVHGTRIVPHPAPPRPDHT